MEFRTSSTQATQIKTACLVVGVYARRKLTAAARAVDDAGNGIISQLLKKGDFDGSHGQTQLLYDLPGIAASRVMLLGLGAEKDCGSQKLAQAFAKAVAQLDQAQPTEAVLAIPAHGKDHVALYADARDCAIAAEGAVYRFDQCKSEVEPPKRPLRKLTLLADNTKDAKQLDKGAEHGKAIAAGMKLAKDLANLPGNICTPSYLADQAKLLGRQSRKLKVSVLEEKDMEKLGMGSLLSVSQGSRQPAKLIVMEYKGGKPGSKPVALVGKGLTFDAGGISLKPGQDMDQMKYDMCGGASVLGAIASCLALDLPLNVVGVVPSSENLPDGQANKPGDIVTSMSGQTIEILNTDAEGRLILCDALTYTERFEPAAVIDIATLTGACIIALGHHASGLMANDDKLAEDILAAGTATNDRAWRLPIWDDYQQQLDSNFADMANIGGRSAGAITAACFLARYTKKFKWAHLDIAGTAWMTGKEKGATGRPVPILVHYLLKRAGLAH